MPPLDLPQIRGLSLQAIARQPPEPQPGTQSSLSEEESAHRRLDNFSKSTSQILLENVNKPVSERRRHWRTAARNTFADRWLSRSRTEASGWPARSVNQRVVDAARVADSNASRPRALSTPWSYGSVGGSRLVVLTGSCLVSGRCKPTLSRLADALVGPSVHLLPWLPPALPACRTAALVDSSS